MNIKPVNTTKVNYPGHNDHFCASREFLKIAAALGLVTCTVLVPVVHASEPQVRIAKVKAERIAKEKIPTVVDGLLAKLKDDQYRVREGATVKLIQLGQGLHSATKEKTAVKKLVIKLMGKKLKIEKDPETLSRIHRVINALSPKKHHPLPARPSIAGGMMAPN